MHTSYVPVYFSDSNASLISFSGVFFFVSIMVLFLSEELKKAEIRLFLHFKAAEWCSG